MRCEYCEFNYYDYSEDHQYCWLGIESYDNGKSYGCKYNKKALKKFADHQEKEEANEYARMGRFFAKLKDVDFE